MNNYMFSINGLEVLFLRREKQKQKQTSIQDFEVGYLVFNNSNCECH